MGIRAGFKKILEKGFKITIGGKMFDPTYQVRTDAVQDIVKSKSKKEGDKWEFSMRGKSGR
jgi:hypothetical protein